VKLFTDNMNVFICGKTVLYVYCKDNKATLNEWFYANKRVEKSCYSVFGCHDTYHIKLGNTNLRKYCIL